MGDPVSSVKHIAEVALKIKQAVETVRKNKEDCRQIRRRVVRVSDILSMLQETENIVLSNPAMSAALEDLAETLRHAHALVVACQEKNVVCLFCTATTLSKKLRRVNDDISDQVMVGIFATCTAHVTIVLKQPETMEPQPTPEPEREPEPEPSIQFAPPPPKQAPLPPPPKLELPPPPQKEPMPPPLQQPPPLLPNEKPKPPSIIITVEPPALKEEATPPSPRPPLPPWTICPPPKEPRLATGKPWPRRGQLRIGSFKRVLSASLEKPEPPLSEPPPSSPPSLKKKPDRSPAIPLLPSDLEEELMPPMPLLGKRWPAEECYGYDFAPARESKESEKSSLSSSGIQKFSFFELGVATQQFATRIGEGGFATVYKGVLHDGLEVAIRKQACPSGYDEMPTMHPLIHLCSMLEHKNIVKLLGYCHENRGILNENTPKGIVGAKEEFLLLVEEYMTNGNLSNFIYGEQLDWSSRFRIILGITEGIIYLHTHSEKPTVVHLDLKPDNILLDSDMNPKIGDFGLAKELLNEEINATVRGTLGYMPPEYIVEGVISIKNDVYGFGVTLLETISGMSESGRDARHQASIEWAWNVRNSGAMNNLFHPSLCNKSQLKEIKRCMETGLLCTQNKPTDRPTMSDVLEMLQGKKKVPTPKQPGYIKRVRAVERNHKHL